MEVTLEVKGIHKESMSAIYSAASRGSNKATKTVSGNNLTVQLTCISYPANNIILH